MMRLLTNYPNKLIPGESHKFYKKILISDTPLVSKKIQIFNPIEIEENQCQPSTLNPKLDGATRTARPEGLAALLKAMNECQVNKLYQMQKYDDFYSFSPSLLTTETFQEDFIIFVFNF
jgi:hypothetical protein